MCTEIFYKKLLPKYPKSLSENFRFLKFSTIRIVYYPVGDFIPSIVESQLPPQKYLCFEQEPHTIVFWTVAESYFLGGLAVQVYYSILTVYCSYIYIYIYIYIIYIYIYYIYIYYIYIYYIYIYYIYIYYIYIYYIYIIKYKYLLYIYIYIYIYNYIRNSVGLLGLISVVLTSKIGKPIIYRQLKCPTLVVHLSHARVL